MVARVGELAANWRRIRKIGHTCRRGDGASGEGSDCGDGDLMGRPADRGQASRMARAVRCGLAVCGCVALAGCSATRLSNHSYSDKVVADGEPVPKGGGTYRVGQPYTVNGQTYLSQRQSLLSGGRHRLLVRPRFSRPADRERRSLRYAFDIGGPPDAADPELRPRHQSRQQPLDHRAGQRSRSLRAGTHHRSVHRCRARTWLLWRWPRPCAGRVCRARPARRQRRQHVARHVAAGSAGARTLQTHAGVRWSVCSRLRTADWACRRCRPNGRSRSVRLRARAPRSRLGPPIMQAQGHRRGRRSRHRQGPRQMSPPWIRAAAPTRPALPCAIAAHWA